MRRFTAILSVSRWAGNSFAPWRGVSVESTSPTTTGVPPNPWDSTRGAPVYVWRDQAQIDDATAQAARERETEILDAIETAMRVRSEQRDASRTPPTDGPN